MKLKIDRFQLIRSYNRQTIQFYFSQIQQLTMQSRISGKQPADKKCTSIPYFLQSKHLTKKQLPDRMKKIANASKQYQEFTFVNQKQRASLRKRISSLIRHVPKVIIIQQTPQKLVALIQCPKKLFVQNLKPFRKSVQIQKIYEAVLALFELAEFYGYFYCDKLMLRVSEDGSTVVWINQKFQDCERQCPIRPNAVSELIFIKKLADTFSNFIYFPSQIATKKQVVTFFESQKSKFQLGPMHLSLSPTKKHHGSSITKQKLHKQKQAQKQKQKQKQKSFLKVQIPTSSFTPRKAMQKKSARNSRQKKISIQRLAFSKQKDKLSQNPRKYSKKMYQVLQKNQERTKTMKLQHVNSYLDSSLKQVSQNLSKSKRQQASSASQSGLSRYKANATKLKTMQNLKLSNGTQVNEEQEYKQEEKDTLYDEFNFSPESFGQNKLKNQKPKSRKQSVDVNLVSKWFNKSQKVQQAKFPNSTFSTRVTFSSLQALLQNSIDNEQRDKDKKQQPNAQNHTKISINTNNNQKEEKKKLSPATRKMMKQSGMKISQQNSFENQMQNLLSSNITQQQKKQRLKGKESMLISQLQKLFNSSNYEQQVKDQDIKNFENILL